MNFVEELPPDGRGSPTPVDIDTLRQNAGRWAEVGRFPTEKRASASSRGRHLAQRFPDVEYTTRTVAGEVVVFVRAVSA